MNISFLISQMGDGGSGQTLTHKTAEYFFQNNNISIISIYESALSKNHNYKVYNLKSNSNKVLQPFNLFKLKKVLKKEKTDILVCEHTSFFYCYIKLFFNVKVIWVDHGSLWWRHRIIKNKMNTLWREKRILKYSDRVVSLTNDNREAYKTFFPQYSERVIVIPNFVSVDLPKDSYNFASKKIITVGRCDAGKDYGTTIDCFEKATINNCEWELYIYAGGPLYGEVQQIIVSRKLQNRVHLIKGEAPLNIYTNKSFFIMNSWHEGFPLVLLEALKCGLPIISYNCHSGPSEVVDDGKNGYLIKLGDSEAYIKRISELINNKNLCDKMSEEAFKKSKLFSFENSMKKWNQLFESTIK